MQTFTLENGVDLPIVPGFREQVKSNWRSAFRDFEYQPLDIEKAGRLKHDIKHATTFLSKYNIDLRGKRVMDVGCYLGLQCFGAVELGAAEAVGIDIPEYYVNQATNEDVDASKILADRRKQIADLHSPAVSEKVSFLDMSVFEMDFENEFDIIFSWETFEHITDPGEGLKRIYKALKPGGVSFNVYNPFYCLSGGHSMCTLDYPFAHTMLSDSDFKKYVEAVQPNDTPKDYSKLAYNFFTKNLNRMSQQQLRNYIQEAGFSLVDFLSLPELNRMELVDPMALNTAQQLNPTVTLNDFLCSYVYFTVRK